MVYQLHPSSSIYTEVLKENLITMYTDKFISSPTHYSKLDKSKLQDQIVVYKSLVQNYEYCQKANKTITYF